MRSAIPARTRDTAKALRAAQTPQERRLWAALRRLRGPGIAHFRRQAPVGPFIADFADYARRLIVEADGGGHGGPADARRDVWLCAQGFTVLRFWNHEIEENLDGVMQVVAEACAARRPARGKTPPPAPPHKGEGSAPPQPANSAHTGATPATRAPSPLVGEGRGGGGRRAPIHQENPT